MFSMFTEGSSYGQFLEGLLEWPVSKAVISGKRQIEKLNFWYAALWGVYKRDKVETDKWTTLEKTLQGTYVK